MKIYFEAKRLFYNNTGLGNYARWLLEEYHVHYPEDDLFLLKPEQGESKYNQIFHAPEFNIVSYTNFLGMHRVFSLLNKIPKDGIFHGLSAEMPLITKKIKKNIVTVHDLIFIRRPNDYTLIDRTIYKQKLKYALQHADQIIAISQITADDIKKHYTVDESKVKIIYQNCNKIFYGQLSSDFIGESRLKFNLPEVYLLCVSSFNDRKNLQSIVEAYRIIPPESRIPFVFVGSGNLKEKIVHLVAKCNLNKYFIFLDYVPPTDLPAIYQGSMALIYPSVMEGFGIPAIEAMASRIPVIGHQHTSVEEAAGEAGMFVDCTNPESLATAIQQVLEDSVLRNQFKQAAIIQLKKYENSSLMRELNSVYSV